jgi:ribosomal-protein-alanine N-acetyltransferase
MSPKQIILVPRQWGFAVVLRDEKTTVGIASFKGPPDADGIVEISYGIAQAFQGRGFATEVVQTLIEMARESGRVSRIIAHTAPTNEASKRVLTKCGFGCVGEATDPKDGLVLRWERPL